MSNNQQNTNNIDDDLKKYIFEPEHPKDFLIYKLLLKIITERKNQVMFDLNFIYEIFKDRIFDREVEEKLWDKPENYHSLTAIEKADVFVKNYTLKELIELIVSKLKSHKSFLSEIFNKFVTAQDWVYYEPPYTGRAVRQRYDNSGNSFGECLDFSKEKAVNEILSSFSGIYNQVATSDNLKIYKEYIEKGNTDIIFLTQQYKHLLSYYEFSSTSIIITTLEDFPAIRNHENYNENAIKPILLKKIEDIHFLLDILYRDTKGVKTVETKQQKVTYINSINIRNYFSLKNIELKDLSDKKEIYLLGENGDGKTILLQAILLALKGNENEGVVNDVIKYNFDTDLRLKATDSAGVLYEFHQNPKKQKKSLKNIFAYGVNRFNTHKEKQDKTGYLTLFSNEQYLENPENWLKYIDHREAKELPVAVNLREAKDILSELLDKNIDFEVSPDKVRFFERGTELSFEQLSDGYKSVISWTADLITRLSTNQPEAKSTKDFMGIVLVDEIDMFLHPKWEYTLVKKLRRVFPGIQFLFTSHSPVLLLGASRDAVFYKLYKEKGETKISEPWTSNDIIHLMANGLITSPLFDLPSARMKILKDRSKLDTSPDFWVGKIHEKIREQLEREKQAGKQYLSKQEVDEFVEQAIAQIDKELG